VRVGQGASASEGGELPVGESVRVRFDVLVDAAPAGAPIVNAAEVQFRGLTTGAEITVSTVGTEGPTRTWVCQNGIVAPVEDCDDGNADEGDGCSSTCEEELGWMCVDSPSQCDPVCGDGLIRGDETCDDGAEVSGDGCSSVCQVEQGWT